jgi:hypothetical protein
MRSPKYPLESLAAHRARQVEGAVEGLATAVHQRERAEQQRHAADQRKVELDARAARVLGHEREGLERGELRAEDLAHAHAWQLRHDSEVARAEEERRRTLAAEVDATQAETAARRHVAERRADADVVEKDRERWAAGRRKQLEAKEEEAMAEAFRPKR